MSYKRRTGNRTTVIQTGDTRAKGQYEQTADWPSATSMYAAAALMIGSHHTVRLNGLFDNASTFDYANLVALASVGRNGTVGVLLVDLLAAAHLAADAEVLIVADRYGDSLALPVRDVLAEPDAQLTLGTTRAALRHDQGGPVRIDVTGWSVEAEPLAVTTIRAVAFDEFIRCS